MTDVVSQLEAVIAGIEERTEHLKKCPVARFPKGRYGRAFACRCYWRTRVRTEIARTVERMLNAALPGRECCNGHPDGTDCGGLHRAAAFRATQEQETRND